MAFKLFTRSEDADVVGSTDAPPAAGAPAIVGSPEQEAIWDAVEDNQENILVNACAGSGKTYTSLESAKRIKSRYPDAHIGYIVFGKANQAEMEAKANGILSSITYHSLGFRAIKNAFPRQIKVNQDRMWTIIDSLRKWNEKSAADKLTRTGIKKLSGLAKLYGACLREQLEEIVEQHDLDLGSQEVEAEVIHLVPEALEKAMQVDGEIDFDDMPWLPYALDLPIPSFDFSMIDECVVGDTPILMPDYSLRKIEDLVASRY